MFEAYGGEEIHPGKDVQTDDEWLDYARRNGGTVYHPVGSCKMGTDRMAVVDPQQPLFLGLMSGTSADGIDAALVQFPDEGGCRFVHGHTFDWQPATRAALVALGQGQEPASLDALGQLDAQVGTAFAAAAGRLRIISSDGSTAVTSRSTGSYDPVPAPTFSTLRASPSAVWIIAAMRGSGLRRSA